MSVIKGLQGLAIIKTAWEMEKFARDGEPGQRVLYHHGFIAVDRQGNSREARRIDRLAARAHELGEIDEIILRPCGHIKAIKPAQHRVRLLQKKDPDVEGARFYFAELF
jgi:hypothetical protein